MPNHKGSTRLSSKQKKYALRKTVSAASPRPRQTWTLRMSRCGSVQAPDQEVKLVLRPI